jgi:hypothetical protein
VKYECALPEILAKKNLALAVSTGQFLCGSASMLSNTIFRKKYSCFIVSYNIMASSHVSLQTVLKKYTGGGGCTRVGDGEDRERRYS